MTRILKEHIVRLIAGDRSAGFDKEVKIAIAIPVGKRGSVTFLKVARPGGRRDVYEALSVNVFEHQIGDETRKAWQSRA